MQSCSFFHCLILVVAVGSGISYAELRHEVPAPNSDSQQPSPELRASPSSSPPATQHMAPEYERRFPIECEDSDASEDDGPDYQNTQLPTGEWSYIQAVL